MAAAAFSTLGWFSDPLLSTTVGGHRASVVETMIHQMAHTTLYVKSATSFNESFASFVGFRGAEPFFRARGDTAAAEWAVGVWRDEIRLGRFYVALVDTLRAAYATGVAGAALDSVRSHLFGMARERLRCRFPRQDIGIEGEAGAIVQASVGTVEVERRRGRGHGLESGGAVLPVGLMSSPMIVNGRPVPITYSRVAEETRVAAMGTNDDANGCDIKAVVAPQATHASVHHTVRSGI